MNHQVHTVALHPPAEIHRFERIVEYRAQLSVVRHPTTKPEVGAALDQRVHVTAHTTFVLQASL